MGTPQARLGDSMLPHPCFRPGSVRFSSPALLFGEIPIHTFYYICGYFIVLHVISIFLHVISIKFQSIILGKTREVGEVGEVGEVREVAHAGSCAGVAHEVRCAGSS